MILPRPSVDVDAFAPTVTHSIIWPCSDRVLDIDLKSGCDPSSSSWDMGSRIFTHLTNCSDLELDPSAVKTSLSVAWTIRHQPKFGGVTSLVVLITILIGRNNDVLYPLRKIQVRDIPTDIGLVSLRAEAELATSSAWSCAFNSLPSET